MGGMCCLQSSNQNKYEFVSTEQEALINLANNSLTTDVHGECRDLQIKMENKGVGVEDSANPKSFCQQISIEGGFVVENEKNEHFAAVKQEDSDRPQPLRTDLESATASESILAPPEFEKAKGSPHIAVDSQANLKLENGTDKESEKEDFPPNTQLIVNESDHQEHAVTLRQTSVDFESEGNVSVGHQNTASHMLKNKGCNAFEKGEQSTHIELEQQAEKNDVSCGPSNTMQHEDERRLQQESAGVTCHSVLETSVMTTKRVGLSPECDHRDNQTVNLAEGTKGQMQVVDSHGDESEATNLENKPSDPRTEDAFRDQQSDTDKKTAEDLCDKTRLRDRSFDDLDATNEKPAAEPEDVDHGFVKDEDLYRDVNEIEEEKSRISRMHENQITAARDPSSLEPNVDIMEYCAREWKSSTTKAQLIKKAYATIHHTFSSVRRIRGDNYCALRATVFQVLSNIELPEWMQDDKLLQYPEKLITENYIWIKQWNFGAQGSRIENPVEKLKEYLTLLKRTWTDVCGMASQERQSACEKIFSGETEEYSLFEAVKFLMLVKAIELDHDKLRQNEVPLFCWLLFARDTSESPYMFMKNHLNHIGYTGGLDQVEMFLLGYTMRLTIRVFRLYKFGTDEFITFYPDDHQEDWPTITLITEDDRHYNVLVGELEATKL